MEVSANPVIGPVVSSERTTSRNGLMKAFGSISVSSVKTFNVNFKDELQTS